MRHRPDLDGVRALAVLAVFMNHAPFVRLQGGWSGVDVFFVLSGYLITTLLVAERNNTGQIRFGAFYLRRVLRLYPALIAMLLISITYYREMVADFAEWAKGAAGAALYFRDFTAGYHEWPAAAFGHTWTLAIEEQFYLIWPPVLAILLARRRDPLRWTVAGAAGSYALLIYNCRHSGPDGYPSGYYLPWDHGGQLLVGCAVAFLVQREVQPRWLAAKSTGWLIAALIAAHWLAAGTLARATNLWWQVPTMGLLAGALLLHLEREDSPLRRALAARPLTYLGRRSYGFYLYFLPLGSVVEEHLLQRGRIVAFACSLAATFAASVLSYRFVELPFLRLKHRRFEPPSHPPEPVPT